MDQGFARLPGAGYEALHPELKDTNPEDYPDINKLAILADVAPYSREYNTYRQKVGKEAKGNTELEIEYEKILNRVRQTRESVIRMNDRRFTAPVDEITGTVDEVSSHGITLKTRPFHRAAPKTPRVRATGSSSIHSAILSHPRHARWTHPGCPLCSSSLCYKIFPVRYESSPVHSDSSAYSCPFLSAVVSALLSSFSLYLVIVLMKVVVL